MATKMLIPDALYIGGVTSITLGLFSEPSAVTEPSQTDNVAFTAGQAGFAAGTAAAPSISFAADLDTGMYRSGANILGLGVAGGAIALVKAVGVNVTGNVEHGAVSAFGTTEPTSASTYKAGTAAAGAVTTSGGFFTDGSTMKKIIAAGTVSDVQT